MSSVQRGTEGSSGEAAQRSEVPMGVRTHAVIPARWVAVALLAAVGLAALVFYLLPVQQPAVRQTARADPAPAPPVAPAPAVATAPNGSDAAPSDQRRAPSKAAEKPHVRSAAEPTVVARDPGAPPAQAPRARQENASSTQQFEQLMTRALGQLERSEWQAAEQGFASALMVRPGDQAAADGLARAREGAARDALVRLQREAQGFEETERWEEARTAYLRAATIDPAVDFARQGAKRSERMAQLHARVEQYLANPARLYSPAVRDEAKGVLESLDREAASGPRMAQARQQLAAALKRSTTKVTVRFASDNATEVTLLRMGPLGRFRDRAIELTPGTYTLLGSRPGYKDVRVELTVEPDAPAPRVFVACEERV